MDPKDMTGDAACERLQLLVERFAEELACRAAADNPEKLRGQAHFRAGPS